MSLLCVLRHFTICVVVLFANRIVALTFDEFARNLTNNELILTEPLFDIARLVLSDVFPETIIPPVRLWDIARQYVPNSRGFVLPLFYGNSVLGFSLLIDFERKFGLKIPVEVPHCGDLDIEIQEQMIARFPSVRVYDVCDLAALEQYNGHKIFCRNVKECHDIFRSFLIGVLAVVYSTFDEIMLLDADTQYFSDPTETWELEDVKETGVLLFRDRVVEPYKFLLELTDQGNHGLRRLHQFLGTFDPRPYHFLGHIPTKSAPKGWVANVSSTAFRHYKPSKLAMTTHAWNFLSGHNIDSSFVLWKKSKQPRATTLLASFVSLNGVPPPPSYGDKEFFFFACELAETAYAVSKYGAGSITSNDPLSNNTGLCGDALHYLPARQSSQNWSLSASDGVPFYTNGDYISTWDPKHDNLFHSMSTPGNSYPSALKRPWTHVGCLQHRVVVNASEAMKNAVAERIRAMREVQFDLFGL
uniref:Uncharacterized protein AlNc14C229G9267 n=1 Tax=Albugo laibachii Nc14 TaxID=890382 RepID=F0WSC7_9STRA|nr:conserved hypothetical protein [Albugo laibachii Nc14]CCA25884.1 conserved hypothetical protein [Albugo laibachii Nc14]|eukprot:CCA25884.1 conserved hypothetical protein [Albugo laibachii Nc14]